MNAVKSASTDAIKAFKFLGESVKIETNSMSNSDNSDAELDDYEMEIDDGGADVAKNATGAADIGTDEEDLLLEDGGGGQHYLVDSGDDSGDDTDDDTDDDDDAEAKLVAKYLAILERIASDKTNYDNYVQLVDVAQ